MVYVRCSVVLIVLLHPRSSIIFEPQRVPHSVSAVITMAIDRDSFTPWVLIIASILSSFLGLGVYITQSTAAVVIIVT